MRGFPQRQSSGAVAAAPCFGVTACSGLLLCGDLLGLLLALCMALASDQHTCCISL